MNARRPNKTVDGTRKNTALTPNRGPLIVGDSNASEPKTEKVQKPKRVPFGSYMDADLQRRFKAECALMGVEMQSALEEAVHDWLKKYPRPAG